MSRQSFLFTEPVLYRQKDQEHHFSGVCLFCCGVSTSMHTKLFNISLVPQLRKLISFLVHQNREAINFLLEGTNSALNSLLLYFLGHKYAFLVFTNSGKP